MWLPGFFLPWFPGFLALGPHPCNAFTLTPGFPFSWPITLQPLYLGHEPKARVATFLLFHCPPPCGGIAFQVGLGKLHGRVSSNLGGMQIILHFRKPSIHKFSVTGTIEISRFGWFEPRILGCSSFEGRNQLTKIELIHLEEDFQFLGE